MSCKWNSRELPVLICAYHEEATIGKLVRTIVSLPHLPAKVRPIVVDDGSSDATALQAKQSGAEVLSLKRNRGKATAFYAGLCSLWDQRTTGHLITLDADLEEVHEEQIHHLLRPFQDKSVEMTIGSVCGASSSLSGQRAFRLDSLSKLVTSPRYAGILAEDSPLRVGYGLETVLNYAVTRKLDLSDSPPSNVCFVPTNFTCVSGCDEKKVSPKLQAPLEVARARALCRYLD